MTAVDNDTTRAATIVADWLTGLWVSRPTWLNRMPDKEHVDQLVSAIAANIPNRAATAPSDTLSAAQSRQLADELARLCYAETEGKFFDCVTDNIGSIIAALRANRAATEVPSGVAIIQIMREHLRVTMERDRHGIVFQIDPVSVGAAAAAILALQDKGTT